MAWTQTQSHARLPAGSNGVPASSLGTASDQWTADGNLGLADKRQSRTEREIDSSGAFHY